jgi:hypothetical protein
MSESLSESRTANLDPIAGVGLELYAKVSRGIAPYGYDQSKLPRVARAFGVAPGDWALAQDGWTARIHEDRDVASLFSEYYKSS